MTDTERISSPRIGLDVGTSRIVMARRPEREFQFESQLNAFVTVPFSRLTENLLAKRNIPYRAQGSELFVYGNESETFADLFHIETRRPMLNGVLNPNEPESLDQIRMLLASLIGNAKKEGQKAYFSVPGQLLDSGEDMTYHEATVKVVLSELGYDVQSINEALAVVYAELEDSNYTGIGISCGGGMCNICLAYLSVPVVTFSIATAGDFIDNSVAAVTGEVATRVRRMKEASFQLNGKTGDKIQQAIIVYYDKMIDTLVEALVDGFSKNLPKLGGPVPIALSGGTAVPAGFRERFERKLRASEFPVAVSEVRLATDPLTTTAKGALVAALADA